MGCPIAIADTTDILNLSFWGVVTLIAHCVGTYMFWNKRWYAYLHTFTLAPAEKVTFTALVALSVANAFAAWRVWFCDNWDTTTGLMILAVYFFMIVVHNLFIPSVMLTTSAILSIVIALGSSILSILFTVFCYMKHHEWSGLIGIADIVVNLGFLIFAVQLQTMPKLYTKYDDIKGEYQPVSKKPTSEKSSVAPVQSAIGSQYPISGGAGSGELRFRPNAGTPTPAYNFEMTINP
jgi:hypothetical protein